MKSKALNKAWTTRWKKANSINPNLQILIIIPKLERVDNAIIFFRSNSFRAQRPAKRVVKEEIKKIKFLIHQWLKTNSWKRIVKKTPAVTKVDEWTKALTGVGAAIAAGSQALNGIWALFVIAAKIRKTLTIFASLLPLKKGIQDPSFRSKETRIKKKTSPNRL